MNLPSMGDASVILNKRTLRIGPQTYALNNLARVQISPLDKPADDGKGNGKLAKAAAFGSAFLCIVIGAAAQQPGAGLVFGLFVAAAVGIAVYLSTRKSYPPLFALRLETTGNPQTALISFDRAELERASQAIVNAMENPPDSERIVNIHNVALGDQINQVGDYNTGKVTA